MEDVLPFVESPVSPAFLYYAIMNHIVIIHVLACMLFCLQVVSFAYGLRIFLPKSVRSGHEIAPQVSTFLRGDL